MIIMEDREAIRRAYYIEKKSIRQIAREQHHSRRTVAKAIKETEPRLYQQNTSRPAPVLGSFHNRVNELLTQNKTLPSKQRYTVHKIYEILVAEGYQGSESHLRRYVAGWRRQHQQPHLYLPLDYEPGQDAQVDWGEAIAVIGGVRQTVQVFVMRLCYSRRTFVMTFPSQNQESFLFAHVQAFQYFGGVPARMSYDNLGSAVTRPMGKDRRGTESRTFVPARS